jgi:ribosomal protein S18 acetylase RimI-like enzyme
MVYQKNLQDAQRRAGDLWQIFLEANMMFKYRPAAKGDSAKLAELINIASDGVVEYLFHDLVPGMTPIQVVAHNLENDHYPHSYRSAVVATEETDVIGMALSYPSSYHKITDEMRSFFPADRLEHLSHFYSSRIENSWFLDALCVIESHRRRGIGEKLISFIKEKAVENGYNAVSLIAFADNELAIPVYKRSGFEIVQKVELRGNEFIRHEDGCLLMKCELTT